MPIQQTQQQQSTVTPFDYTPVSNGVQINPVSVNLPSKTAKVLEGLQGLVAEGNKAYLQEQDIVAKTLQVETQKQSNIAEENKRLYETQKKDAKNKIEAYFLNEKVKFSDSLINAQSTTDVENAKISFNNNMDTFIKTMGLKDQEILNHFQSLRISTLNDSNTNFYYWREKENKRELQQLYTNAIGTNLFKNLSNNTKLPDSNDTIASTSLKDFNSKVDSIFNNPANTKTKNEIVNELFSMIAVDYASTNIKSTSTLLEIANVKKFIENTADILDPKIRISSNYNSLIGQVDNIYKDSLSHLKEQITIARSVDNNKAEITSLTNQLVEIGEWNKATQSDYLKNYQEEQSKKIKSEAAVNFSNPNFNQSTIDSHQAKVVNKKVREALTVGNWKFISDTAVNFPDIVSKQVGNALEVTTNNLTKQIVGADGKPISFQQKADALSSLLHIVNKLPSNNIPKDLLRIASVANTISNSGKANPEKLFESVIEKFNSANPITVHDISPDINKKINNDIPTVDKSQARQDFMLFVSTGMDEKSAWDTISSMYKKDSVHTSHGTITMKSSDFSKYGINPSDEVSNYIIEGSLNRLMTYYKSNNPMTSLTLGSIIKNSSNGIVIEKSSFPGNVNIRLNGRAELITIPEATFKKSIELSKKYEVPNLMKKNKASLFGILPLGL